MAGNWCVGALLGVALIGVACTDEGGDESACRLDGCDCSANADCEDPLVCNDGFCGDEITPGYCGDGFIDRPAEECDLGLSNAPNAACTSDCVRNICGDGLQWVGEESCDDGNEVPDDGCDECTLAGDAKWSVIPGDLTDRALADVDLGPNEMILALLTVDAVIVQCSNGACSDPPWPSAKPPGGSELYFPHVRASSDGGAFVAHSYDLDNDTEGSLGHLSRYSEAGEILWTTVLPNRSGDELWPSAIEYSGDRVAVVGQSADRSSPREYNFGYAAVLDLEGNVLWSFISTEDHGTSYDFLTLAEDGSVCVAGAGKVGCLDAAGMLLWSADLGEAPYGLSLGSDQSLEVITTTGRRVYDAASGAAETPLVIDWGMDLHSAERFGDFIAVGGTNATGPDLAVFRDDTRVFAVNPEALEGDQPAGPTVHAYAPDGTLYVSEGIYLLKAFETYLP